MPKRYVRTVLKMVGLHAMAKIVKLFILTIHLLRVVMVMVLNARGEAVK
jgi:hypothetical protein